MATMSLDDGRRQPEEAAPDAGAQSPSVSRLSILHVVAPAEFGGLETVLRMLAGGFCARGHAVHVATVLERERDGRVLCEALRDSGVGVTRLVLPGRSYFAERREVARLCRELGPDVLHTHGYRPDVVDTGVGRRLGIPTVTTAHGFTGGNWRNRAYEWMQRRAMRRFDAVVAVSRAIARQLVGSGVSAQRLRLIPNAFATPHEPLGRVEARRVLGAEPDATLVGFVGRLTREKGADVLVEAIAELKDPAIQVAVIGDGGERRALVEAARARGIASGITWHGNIPGAGRLFAAFDAFVLSSRSEGTPMALFEAMAAEVPVVATAVGGVPDVVSPSEAILVPPEDARALAEGVRAILENPEAAGIRAARARARLEQEYGVEPWLDAYEHAYATLRHPHTERVA